MTRFLVFAAFLSLPFLMFAQDRDIEVGPNGAFVPPPAPAPAEDVPPPAPEPAQMNPAVFELFKRLEQRKQSLALFEETAQINRSIERAREEVVAILGEGCLPATNIRVPEETEPAYFRWESEPEEEKLVVTVTRKRIDERRRLAADFTCLALELRLKEDGVNPVLREAACRIVEESGYENFSLGRLIGDRGGPMTLEALAKHLGEVPPENASPEEKEAYRSCDELAQATLYLIGYDLHSRGLLRSLMSGKTRAKEILSELDPQKAWERHRKAIAPPRRIRPVFLPSEILYS